MKWDKKKLEDIAKRYEDLVKEYIALEKVASLSNPIRCHYTFILFINSFNV